MGETISILRESAACLWLTGRLSLEAYAQRIRTGRGVFAPTYTSRRRTLKRANLDRRALGREPFLRPTPFADSHAPEIVALADEFRANAKTDSEYACAIFEFVSNEIAMCHDFPPRGGVVGILERGFGTCNEKLNLFIALARAGGIPARYCTIGVDPSRGGVMSLLGDEVGVFGVLTHLSKRFVAANHDARATRIASFNLRCASQFRRALEARVRDGTLQAARNQWTHFVAELRIGEGWIAADPTFGDDDCAAGRWPLQRFGYEPLILGRLMGMTITGRSEEMPVRRHLGVLWLAHVCVSRGFLDHINEFCEAERCRGRELLDRAGRDVVRLERQHLNRPISAVADVPG
jgi:hypothetical protein